MRCVRRVSTTHLWFFFLSVVDASDADDEGSSNEAKEPAVNLSDEHSSTEESVVELSDEHSSSEKAAVDLSDEHFSSEESAVELSNEGGSCSEDSDDHSQQPFAALQIPPLDFPASPAPHEAALDNEFNMEGYDQQSDIISGWYATEEEV